MATSKAGGKPVRKFQVDFTGIDSAALVREGDVTFAVKEVTLEKGEKGQYLRWEFQAQAPDKGTVYHNTSLVKQSLWALRTLLEYMELEVPDGPLDFDLDALAGELVGGTVYHETYDGKKQARISGFYNVQSIDGGPAAGAAMTENDGSGDVGEGETAEETVDELPKLTAEAIGEMSDDELKGVIETYSLECDLAEYPTARKRKNAVVDAMETAGHLEPEAAE